MRANRGHGMVDGDADLPEDAWKRAVKKAKWTAGRDERLTFVRANPGQGMVDGDADLLEGAWKKKAGAAKKKQALLAKRPAQRKTTCNERMHFIDAHSASMDVDDAELSAEAWRQKVSAAEFQKQSEKRRQIVRDHADLFIPEDDAVQLSEEDWSRALRAANYKSKKRQLRKEHVNTMRAHGMEDADVELNQVQWELKVRLAEEHGEQHVQRQQMDIEGAAHSEQSLAQRGRAALQMGLDVAVQIWSRRMSNEAQRDSAQRERDLDEFEKVLADRKRNGESREGRRAAKVSGTKLARAVASRNWRASAKERRERAADLPAFCAKYKALLADVDAVSAKDGYQQADYDWVW